MGGQHDDIRYRALGWGVGKKKGLEKALRRRGQLSHLQSGCLRGKGCRRSGILRLSYSKRRRAWSQGRLRVAEILLRIGCVILQVQ